MVDSSAAPEIQQANTAPSGNTSAKDKGDESKKKDVESVEANIVEVDKGKGVVDPKNYHSSGYRDPT